MCRSNQFGLKTLLVLAGVTMLSCLVLWMCPSLVSRKVVAVVFTISATIFTYAEMEAQINSNDFIVRRLQRQQLIGGLAYILAGLMMCNQAWYIMFYLIHNEWIVAFAIGCVFQLYTVFRLPESKE